MNVRIWNLFFAFMLLGGSVWSETPEDIRDRSKSKRAHEREKAALHREWAAVIAREEAKGLLDRAESLRRQAYTEDDERQIYYRAAGSLEKRAGDMFGRAATNFDRAESNWREVGREYRKISEQEREDQAMRMARMAKSLSVNARTEAAQAYESAANAYEPEQGNDAMQALANRERAAAVREQLAELVSN